MTRHPITVPLLVWLVIAGCGGAPARTTTSAAGSSDPSEAQVTRGGELYAGRCAGCHGAGGEGTDRGPSLVGEGALPVDPRSPDGARQQRFESAADVLAWVSENMPPRRSHSLPADDYAAIVAFALHANHVDLGGRVLTVENAPEWRLAEPAAPRP